MPRPSPAAKDAAFRNQNKALGVAAAASGAAGGIALIPVVGPFLAAGVGATGAAFGIRAIFQGQIVRDPPRREYFVPTTLGPPMFGPSALGDSLIERTAAELIDASDEITRALAAMVVAIERASGAEIASNGEALAARLDEAREFAQLASRGLMATSDLGQRFAVAFDDIQDVAPTPSGSTLAIGLPKSTLAILRAAGVTDEYLETPLESSGFDSVRELASALNEASESDYEFSRYLERSVIDETLLEPGFG